MGFLPKALERRNRWRETPHWGILVAAGVPVLILLMTGGSVSELGDLYSFGLLGAFTLTCISLDVVRWHEIHPASAPRQRGAESTEPPPHPVGRLAFATGVFTTILVALAWCTNLVAKPQATLFGGGVIAAGLLIALCTHRLARRRDHTPVLPLVHHPARPSIFLERGRLARPPAMVLAVLPERADQVDAVVTAAQAAAGRDPIIFLYHGRGTPPPRAGTVRGSQPVPRRSRRPGSVRSCGSSGSAERPHTTVPLSDQRGGRAGSRRHLGADAAAGDPGVGWRRGSAG